MEFELLKLPQIIDSRGNLSFLQNNMQIPFNIKRVFWMYDVPGGAIRGGHAYRTQHEVIIALSGSFDVLITLKNKKSHRINLNRGNYGLYLPPMTWRQMENFSTNALSIHLSSHIFNEDDYIRNFDQFLSE